MSQHFVIRGLRRGKAMVIVLHQCSLIVTNGSGILPEVAGVIDATREFGEFFGLDGA